MDFAKYVKVRNEKFGAVVFDTLNEKVYVTNESGKSILRLMSDGLEVPQIAERLGQQYGEDLSEIQGDIIDFVNGLQSAGLLTAAVEEKL